jgi:hypothetical protein
MNFRFIDVRAKEVAEVLVIAPAAFQTVVLRKITALDLGGLLRD